MTSNPPSTLSAARIDGQWVGVFESGHEPGFYIVLSKHKMRELAEIWTEDEPAASAEFLRIAALCDSRGVVS